jgi:hypothetical protein
MKNSWKTAVGVAALGAMSFGTACNSTTPNTAPDAQVRNSTDAGRFAGSFEKAAAARAAQLEQEQNARRNDQRRYDALNSALREKMAPIGAVFSILGSAFPAKEKDHYFSVYTRDGSCAWFAMGADAFDTPFFEKGNANPAITFYLEDDRKPEKQVKSNADMRRVVAIEATKDHIYLANGEFYTEAGEHKEFISPLQSYTDNGQAMDGLARRLAEFYPEKADAIRLAVNGATAKDHAREKPAGKILPALQPLLP